MNTWLDYLKAHENDRTIKTIEKISVFESECVKKSPERLIKELQAALKRAKKYKILGKAGINLKVDTNYINYGEVELLITGEFITDKGFHRRSYDQDIQRMKDNALKVGFEMVPIKKGKKKP